ncbi:MAG: respiratory chain complex I subunit 1 family protein [Thermoplasmataceae archaeon]|jgi:formate hydrogenlyase subunit 4
MFAVTLAETVVQYLFVVLSAPLFAGIIANAKAKIESRKGPGILQPYYDLFKLFRKEVLIPEDSSILFVIVPYIAFGVYSLIALIIPVLVPEPVIFTYSGDFLAGAILFSLAGFLKMAAAMDSRNNFSAMSVSRAVSFTFLSEATLIMVFFGVSLITGTNNPYVTNHFLISDPAANLNLPHVFSTIAFFMIFFYETGKIPVETEGLHEMGMIDSGLNYEYSGKLLAINKWTSYMKQYLLGAVLLNVFLIPWGLNASFPDFLLDIPVMILKWLLLILIVVIVETTLAKLRLFRVIDYLAVALTFSVLFIILSEVV